MTYRVGMIGAGIMGQRMFDNMATHNDFDVTAVFDPAGVRADMAKAATARDILTNADIDLVYIACPPAWHVEYALAAAANNKPVFCEKPLAVDIAESKKLVDAFDASGTPNAVNFSFASSPSRDFVRSLYNEGEFVTVDAIDIRLHFSKWPRAWQKDVGWLGERAQGGYVREVLSHFMYLTESIFGTTHVKNTHVRYPDGPSGTSAETHVWSELESNGIPVSVAGGVGGTGPDRIEFTAWGSKKSCRLDDWYNAYISKGDVWEPAMTEVADPRQVGRIAQLDNLSQFMKGQPHELPDFRAALSVQETIETILA